MPELETVEKKIVLTILEEIVKKRIGSRNRENIVIIAIDCTVNKSAFPEITIKSFKSFLKASSKAHDLLKEHNLHVKEDSQNNVIEGHALQIRNDGQTKVILIDLRNPFAKNDLKPNTLFLSKHLTAKK